MSDVKSDRRKRDTLQVILVVLVAATWIALTAVSVLEPGFNVPSVYHGLMVGVVIWVATGSFPNILGRGRGEYRGGDDK